MPHAKSARFLHAQAVEAKLSETLESRLDDINSLKPGALETVNGDMTMGELAKRAANQSIIDNSANNFIEVTSASE